MSANLEALRGRLDRIDRRVVERVVPHGRNIAVLGPERLVFLERARKRYRARRRIGRRKVQHRVRGGEDLDIAHILRRLRHRQVDEHRLARPERCVGDPERRAHVDAPRGGAAALHVGHVPVEKLLLLAFRARRLSRPGGNVRVHRQQRLVKPAGVHRLALYIDPVDAPVVAQRVELLG